MNEPLWIINHYAQSPKQASAAWHYLLAEYLNGAGLPTTLIAASTELNTNRQTLEPYEKYRQEGNFLRLRAETYQGNGLGRLRNMLQFSSALSRLPELPKPGIILGSSPHPFAVFSAWLLAKKHRAKFVFEIRDLWPESLIELGSLQRWHPLAWILSALEWWLLKQADLVVTVLPGAVDYAIKRGVAKERVVWIPNGIDIQGFPAQPAPATQPFTVMYLGSHGVAQGLQVAIAAMDKLRGEHIQLRLIGAGPQKQALMQQASQLGLTSVHFEDAVPQTRIAELAGQADAFLLHLMPAPAFARYGISPNKMYDYMAAARPVIFACDARNNPIAEANAGVTIVPNDAEAMANAIRTLAAMPVAERVAMGECARRHVEQHFDISVLGQTWLERLRAL